jgi:hypothetical protein
MDLHSNYKEESTYFYKLSFWLWLTVQYHNGGVHLDFREGGISLVLRYVQFYLKKGSVTT